MSGLVAVAGGRTVEPDGVELSRLKLKVDVAALVARGWDPEGRVFAPAADDPLFGYYRCEGVDCPRAGESRRAPALGLCDPCAKNFLIRVANTTPGSEPETRERFKLRPLRRHDQASREQALCLVCRTPGHERAARTKGLCVDCCRHRLARKQTVEEFVAGHRGLGFRGRVRRSGGAWWPTAGGGRLTTAGSARSASGAGRRSRRASAPRRGIGFSRLVRGSRRLTAGGRRCRRSRNWWSGSCWPGCSC